MGASKEWRRILLVSGGFVSQASPNCAALVHQQVSVHVGRKASLRALSMCALARSFRNDGYSVLWARTGIGSLFPTGMCLRRAVGRMNVRTPLDFERELLLQGQSGRPYAVVVLSSAARMYGISERWSHFVAFLGDGNGGIRLYDPMWEVDPEFRGRLSARTAEEYIRHWFNLCLLIS